MCINQQLLNKLTVTNIYLVLDLEACVKSEQKATCYMASNLKSSYNNVVVDPASQKFIAFVMQDGMYIFERLSFGFKNAPAQF